MKSQLIGKEPDAGKDGRQEEKGRQRMRWLDNITDSTDMNFAKLQETVEGRGARSAAVRGSAKRQTDLVTEQQQEQKKCEYTHAHTGTHPPINVIGFHPSRCL